MTNTNMNTNRNTNTCTSKKPLAPVRALRTPYHELARVGSGDGALRVPGWAQHRSVYRSAGRTLYRVGTDRLDEAKRDLDTLSRHGWEVRVDRDGEGDSANITLSRQAA